MADNITKVDTSNISDIKQHFINTVAPQYFELDNINNYNIGIFGYINEILGSTVEDSFSAISIARREFYPVTAEYVSSLNIMASLQGIAGRLVTPAYCEAALVVSENEIVENGTVVGDAREYTIDSVLKIFAGDLQFMLDYPIKIISRKTDKWNHTVYYDESVTNDLNTSTIDARYISNKVVNDNGINYIILFVGTIRQVEMVEESFIIIKDSLLETYTQVVNYTGDLANFEVFYTDPEDDTEKQLMKVPINSTVEPSVPFVRYNIVNDNKIELLFGFNTVFVPQFNSEIKCRIYTSLGTDGNFNRYDGDCQCVSDSTEYPHNAILTMVGRINGSALGGKDKPSIEEYRTSIVRAYSTNNTITTSSDLQIQFDDLSDDISNIKVLFKPKRDDVFDRLYGASILMKEDNSAVVPSNTLDLNFKKSDYLDPTSTVANIIIKPGTLFKYESASSYNIVHETNASGDILTIWDIDPTSNENYFTNPYLIVANITPNIVGYYLNSIDVIAPVVYKYINDASAMQFIARSLTVTRNSLAGEDFYKLSIKLIPAVDLDSTTIVTVPDTNASDYEIKAKYNGRIVSSRYYNDPVSNTSYIRSLVEYYDAPAGEESLYIQTSNSVAGILTTPSTGYKLLFPIGYEFVVGDVIAVKRCTDKYQLHLAGDINGLLYPENIYIPFTIEDYDESTESYELVAYLATNDDITIESEILITDGLYQKDGTKSTDKVIPMTNILVELNVLYNNVGANIINKYSTFTGLDAFTLTNVYTNNVNTSNIYFMENQPFIRSVSSYSPSVPPVTGDFDINISQLPLIGAEWCTIDGNYNYFIDRYSLTYQNLKVVANNLENNFSMALSLYNTYGKSRFYSVGNAGEILPLDNVRISLRFGLRLSLIDSDEFITTFRTYVKEYIESTNSISQGQDIYILNMLSDIKSNFTEIVYMEYYGFNIYDHMAQKIIGPGADEYFNNYIPEFLNLNNIVTLEGEVIPDIEVTILSE